ncbi:hypothetical protein SAMN05216359_101383 [Roseateles sp. YR242]|nr:hypothetical protein SAMN05216359_101383 [Roseateles sp. YR242]
MFAQDGGTNNSHYKPFEEEMKREIDDANSQDEITFVAYLVGDGITPIIQGDIMSSAKPTRSPISSPARANNNDDNSADEDDLYDSSEEKEDYDDEDFLEKETSRKRKSRKI